MTFAIDLVSHIHHAVQIGPLSDAEAALRAYRDLGNANLLDMSPARRQQAIRVMAQAKIILALERDDVQAAILQRTSELGRDTPLEERLAIAKHFAPEAFTVTLA